MPLFNPDGSIVEQGLSRFIHRKPHDDYDVLQSYSSHRLIGRVASFEGMRVVPNTILFDWALEEPDTSSEILEKTPHTPAQTVQEHVMHDPRLAPNFLQELPTPQS